MSDRSLGVYALMASLLFAAGMLMAHPLLGQETHRIAGSAVAVYNLAGQVEVVRGSGSEVVVELTRAGADADRLEVEMGRVGNRETLRVVYPDDRVIYPDMGRGSNTTVRVRDDGTFFGERRGGDRVRISGRGSGLEAHADLRIEVPDGIDIAVYLAAGEGYASGLRAHLSIETGSGSVDVADVVGNVAVDTGSGSVLVARVRGDVSADTGSGSIELEDIVGSRLSADTGSGHVEGRDVSAELVSIDTGSGHIRVDDLSSADIRCDTGSGSVRLGLLTDVDRLVVDTGSGSVTLDVPEGFGAELELDTGSGGIDVDVPVQVEVVKRDYFRGTIGDGVGRVVIETGSGGVDIRGS